MATFIERRKTNDGLIEAASEWRDDLDGQREINSQAEVDFEILHDLIAEVRRLQAIVSGTRTYVEFPGNWSALDGRRAEILARLDGFRSAVERTSVVASTVEGEL